MRRWRRGRVWWGLTISGSGVHDSVTFTGNSFFGSHHEMYHEAGCVYVYKNSLHFKGCQGIQGVNRVARSLLLQSYECRVHMGVFSVNLGKRVYTGIGCFMENRWVWCARGPPAECADGLGGAGCPSASRASGWCAA